MLHKFKLYLKVKINKEILHKLKLFINSKVINNIIWLFFDKIVRMGLGIFVIILLARYLGPSQYGILNYAQAIVALFFAISGMGMYGVVVRDLVKSKNPYPLLGTTFILKLFSASVAYVLLIILIYYIRPDDEISKYIISILGLTLVFKASDIIKYWFEAEIKSKYTVYVENSVFIFISCINLLMIYYKFSLISFVYALTLESLLTAIFLFLVYARQHKLLQWKFEKEKAKYLLTESWPLMISSVAWVLYTRIDQIMIGQLLGDTEVGLYSAAIRLSDVANFIPTIIAFSIIPSIIQLKEKNSQLYEKKFQGLYYIVISILVILSGVVFIFSDDIIYILYGNEYIQSSNVLVISFWITIFVAFATISGKYLLNAGLQKITLKRHLFGLFLNISLNYFMIPKYGIEGAATASLISLIVANYIFDYFSRNTRNIFFQKTKALFFVWIIEYIYNKNRKKNG